MSDERGNVNVNVQFDGTIADHLVELGRLRAQFGALVDERDRVQQELRDSRRECQAEKETRLTAVRERDEERARVPYHRSVGYLQAHYDMGKRDIDVGAKIYDDFEGGVVSNERFAATVSGRTLAFRDAVVTCKDR